MAQEYENLLAAKRKSDLLCEIIKENDNYQNEDIDNINISRVLKRYEIVSRLIKQILEAESLKSLSLTLQYIYVSLLAVIDVYIAIIEIEELQNTLKDEVIEENSNNKDNIDKKISNNLNISSKDRDVYINSILKYLHSIFSSLNSAISKNDEYNSLSAEYQKQVSKFVQKDLDLFGTILKYIMFFIQKPQFFIDRDTVYNIVGKSFNRMSRFAQILPNDFNSEDIVTKLSRINNDIVQKTFYNCEELDAILFTKSDETIDSNNNQELDKDIL